MRCPDFRGEIANWTSQSVLIYTGCPDFRVSTFRGSTVQPINIPCTCSMQPSNTRLSKGSYPFRIPVAEKIKGMVIY